MAGRRSLTSLEERALLRVVRRLPPRDRALITVQWFTGFRIHEVLSLKLGSVLRAGDIVEKIGVAPRHLKGGRGRTRWVPVLPEMHRALQALVGWYARRLELDPELPLFLSRECDGGGDARPLSDESARRILHRAFAAAGIANDGRLGTHTLRKTFARKVYEVSGHDILLVKRALHHSDISVTQAYLEADEARVSWAIAQGDFTARRRAPRGSCAA
jgi:integrase